MRLCLLILALVIRQSTTFPHNQQREKLSETNRKKFGKTINDENLEKDSEKAKEIIGSSVVTSVSVILNGNEPQFTDAIGKPIPKPLQPLHVASPINLLNPDRYEFYTFDDNGELVKRLMTLHEIQSIVANGDGDGGAILHNIPINNRDPEKNVQDIVASVQNVLTKEVEWKRNATGGDQPVLDTPDVTSSWSLILPAIFGNTGGDIFPASRPQQVFMTPDTVVVEASSKSPVKSKPTTAKPVKSKPTKKKTTTATTTTSTTTTTSEKPLQDTKQTEEQTTFANNQEIVQPIFNRNEFTTVDKTTLATRVSTTKIPKTTRTTTKRIKVKKTSIRPKPFTLQSTEAPTTTTTTTTSTTTTASTRTTIPATSTTSLPTASSTATPHTVAAATNGPSTSSSTVEFHKISSTSEIPDQILPLPTSSTPANIHKVSTESSASFANVSINHTSPFEEITSPLPLTSEEDDDMNTKISFDQILESLKDDTERVDSNEINTHQPVMYSSGAMLQNENNIETQTSINLKASETLEKLKLENVINEEMTKLTAEEMKKDEMKTETTEKTEKITSDLENLIPVKVLSAEMAGLKLEENLQPLDSSTENLESTQATTVQSSFVDDHQSLSNEHVIKFEPLFADTKEPIVTDITTHLPTKNIQSTAGMLQAQIDDENISTILNEEIATEPMLQTKQSTQTPSAILAELEQYIAENFNNTDEVSVDTAKGEEVLSKLNVTDYREQAATVGSLMEDNQAASEKADPVSDDADSSQEIQSLLSEVLNQITDISPSTIMPDLAPGSPSGIVRPDETSNRLSNVAKINAGLLMPQSPERIMTPQSNIKFEKLETLALKKENDKEKEVNNTNDKITYETSIVKETSSISVEQHSGESIDETKKDIIKNKLVTVEETSIAETSNVTDNEEKSTILPLQSDEETQSTTIKELLETTTLNIEELTTISSNSMHVDSQESENSATRIEEFQYASEHQEYLDTMTKISQDETSEVSDTQLPSTTDTNLSEESTTVTTIEDNPTPFDILNTTETEHSYIKLGESTYKPEILVSSSSAATTEELLVSKTDEPFDDTDDDDTDELTESIQLENESKNPKPSAPSTLKPVHYHKQSVFNENKYMTFNNQRPLVRPPALSNLKVNQLSQVTRSPVKLDPTPEQSLGLEASTINLDTDIQEFARLCNELAFSYWRSITAEKISPARSLVLAPFALTSMLSMVFLGARGGTSGEMNEILRLDDMVTFNPHLVFKNITESVEHARDQDVFSAAFVREIFTDRANGKILQFFKEKTQQLYSGHVEEVNFNVVNDIIRRRTNLLMKRHTMGKVMEYLRTNNVWVNGPLATVSSNLFQTDCSRGSTNERDGEMFFQVHPSVRQRRLVPIPAVVWRNGFTAGYDPEMDATAIAFGSMYDVVSTIYVMPGQQGLAAPGDSLERLEANLMENAVMKGTWGHLLTTLMERPGLEVQVPRFSHRSFINASMGLQRMGLKALFNSDHADLRGLTGSSHKDVYLSDMIQINTFSTCAEEKIGENHHVEMYPAPPIHRQNSNADDETSARSDGSSTLSKDNGRAFYDDLLDPKYLELPLPLRPRQARIPDAPRLRFDKPFLYFVRHNPTGMLLFMGRFNPRLLP